MNMLPCPFCGGKNAYVRNIVLRMYRVACDDCGGEGPAFDGRRKHGGQWASDAAVAAWNRREDAERAADKGA